MTLPVKGSTYSFDLALVNASAPTDFLANPTIAAGDFQVSKDGGAYANLASLPSISPSGSIQVVVSLSATEMTADKVSVKGIDVAGAEWRDVFIGIDIPVSTVDSLADSNNRVDVGSWLGTAVTSGTGGPDINVNAISDDLTAPIQLEQNLLNDIRGIVSGTPTVVQMVTDVEITSNSQFNGRIITFDDDTTTVGLRRQSTDIVDGIASTNTLTFTQLTEAPVSTDSFVIT